MGLLHFTAIIKTIMHLLTCIYFCYVYSAPPSYAECMNGKVDIRDNTDTKHTRGELSWAPTYTYYTWNPPPGQPTYPPAGQNAAYVPPPYPPQA